MAKLGQRAENQWVGVNCGIMDQLISAAAIEGHATLIDCRTLELQPVPLPPETAIVILDTTTRRGLVDSVYNERRSQCEEAAQVLGIPALRDISVDQFKARARELEPLVLRRARHIVTENARALAAADAMRQGDAALLGRLMAASHTSLRDDYQVSSNELNAIVDCAWREKNCYGARMTGAGLGGCAVALVRADAVDLFVAVVSRCYRGKTDLQPNVYVSDSTAGAQVEAVP
jgi:galactokinase